MGDGTQGLRRTHPRRAWLCFRTLVFAVFPVICVKAGRLMALKLPNLSAAALMCCVRGLVRRSNSGELAHRVPVLRQHTIFKTLLLKGAIPPGSRRSKKIWFPKIKLLGELAHQVPVLRQYTISRTLILGVTSQVLALPQDTVSKYLYSGGLAHQDLALHQNTTLKPSRILSL